MYESYGGSELGSASFLRDEKPRPGVIRTKHDQIQKDNSTPIRLS